MNREILNGPLEVGLRVLAVLSSAFPQAFDIASLAYFDYTLLHSSEFGGPESINPDVPNHRTEMAIKRDLIEHGLEVMIRAQLVKVCVNESGIGYAATENGPGFVNLLESEYMHALKDRASWVISEFGDIDVEGLTDAVGRVVNWADDPAVGGSEAPSPRQGGNAWGP